MRFAGHAFVDWDDTIAENIRYFRQAEDANVELIARLTGADPAAVRHRGEELDLAVAKRIGLVKESMGIAWTECYREFCHKAGMEPVPDSEEAVRLACTMPYTVRQELLPGSAEMLAWLHQAGFEITIWTAGDQDVQSRKINESGLAHLVHRRAIVPDKTPDRLLAALGERELERCFVAGNSLHSDIKPALAVGVAALHIPAETWAYDHGHVDLEHPLYTRVESVSELPAVVANRFRMAV